MESEQLTIRCSGLPLAFACPGSARAPQVRIDTTDSSATTGTAVHELLRHVVSGRIPWERIPAMAAELHVSQDELTLLARHGLELWQQVRDSFPGARTEVPMAYNGPGYRLTGHADIVSVTGGESGIVVRVADWKSGRVDSDASAQIKGYALLAWRAATEHAEAHGYPCPREATATALYLRDISAENHTLNEVSLAAFADSIQDRIVDWNGTYRPGDHCGLCPRWHECEARLSYDRAIVATWTNGVDVDYLEELTAARKLELYEQSGVVAKLADSYRAALKREILRSGPIDDGKHHLAVVTEPRSALDPLASWPVLEEQGFTDADFAQVIDIGKTAVNKLVAERAGRGNGARAIRELEARLREAGAMRDYTIQKLQKSRSTTERTSK